MIRINLLPQEFRKTEARNTRVPYVPLVILAGVLFLLLTFFFYADYLRVCSVQKGVKKEWTKLSPLMGELKTLENQVEVEMKGEQDFLEKNVLSAVPMTQILSWVSEFLPAGAWLTEFKVERKGEGYQLVLTGMVLPTRAQTGIEQVEEYCQKLKTKLSPQTSVALTTSRENKETTPGTEFTASLEWGATQKP